MSQADLAREIDVAQPSVNNWATGETKSLRAEVAVKAAKALGVRVEWLVFGSGPMLDEADGVTGLPSISTALPVVLDAIAMCPHRDELRTLLALLVDHDAPAYRQRLAELLGSFDPRGPNLTPKDMELAERVKKAARAAESFDVVGTLKQQVKT